MRNFEKLVLFWVGVCTTLTCLLSPAIAVVEGATLPAGFSESVVFSGLTLPTSVRFSPDGRVFVAEKSGLIKVFATLSATTPTVFHDLRTNVNDFLDRGLMGLELHPNFPTVPSVYVIYTYDKDPNNAQVPRWGAPDATSDPCPTPPGANTDGCVVSGRVSRLETSSGGNVSTGTESVLVEGWGQQYPSHSMDTVMFGPDGALYASAGDGAASNFADYGQAGNPRNPLGDPPVGIGGVQSPPAAEGGATRSQSLRRVSGPAVLNGTLIRVDPFTGAGLPDNPLFSSPDPNARRIVGYGFRNPFRFTFRPGTNELWVGDVGWSAREEINRIPNPLASTVGNFGWPCYEGSSRQLSYDAINLNICETLYAQAGGHTAPYFDYSHSQQVVVGETCPTGSSSIAGLAFNQGGTYPATYQGALFFSDFSRKCIWSMFAGANGLPDPATRATFAADAANPVDLQIGPGGDLFYVDILGGTIRRIQYTSGNQAPNVVIQATPLAGPTPLAVTFDGSASSDPDAGDTLTYSWDLNGDGLFGDAITAQTSFIYTQSNLYNVQLKVTDNHGASNIESISIKAGSPTAFIDTPAASTQWEVGQSLTFSGHATSQGQSTFPPSAFSWEIIMHHCSPNCHTHPIQTFSGVTTASFPAPDHEYPSYLEIKLTVRDAAGLTDTESVLLNPQTVTLNFASTPSGLELVVGSSNDPTPFTRTVIQGSLNSVSAVTPQSLGGITYYFASWSDGGTQSHLIPGTAAATYMATYSLTADTTLPTMPSNLTGSVVSGTQITLSWPASTDNIGVTGYELERCQGVGCTNFAQIATPTTTNYGDSGLTPGLSYSYRVRARDAAGNVSTYSPITTATPTAVLGDNFNRANGLDLGASWDAGYTDQNGANLNLQIVGNRVTATAVGDATETYTGVTLANNQWAQLTLAAANGTGIGSRLLLRFSAPGAKSGYEFALRRATGATSRIAKWNAGVFTQLAAENATTWVAGDVLRAEAEGTTLRLYRNNVLVLTATDATFPSGRAGITVAAATIANVEVDDFSAGERTPLTNWQQVDALALNQATQSLGQGILLVGDSLSNRNPITTMCERPVIRAGYEGGTWHDVPLRPIWPNVQATTAFVLLGTNDAFKTFPLDAAWLAEVQSFLNVIHGQAGQVFLVLPPPIINGATTVNQRIQTIATLLSTLGEQTVDARTIQDSQYFTDGVHLSAAGYLVLNALYGAAACPVADPTPPTMPSNLTGSVVSGTQITLSWPASTDNIGVTGYELERCQGVGCTNFAQIATPTTTNYGDSGLTPGLSYSYRVRARDAAGNVSTYSPITTATPTAVLGDNFNRANGLDLGASWDAGYTDQNGANLNLQIVGNRVTATAVGDATETYTGVTLANNQWAQLTLAAANGTGIGSRLLLRFSAPGAKSGYEFALRRATGATSRIAKWNAGVFTQLAAENATTWVAGDVLRAEAEGTTLRLYRNNVLVLTATDATFPSGRAGITVAAATIANVEVDDFSVGNLTTP